MWKDKPFFGFGYRNFPENFTAEYVNKADISLWEFNRLTLGGTYFGRGSHNDYIAIAVELGTVGLVLFLVWLKKLFLEYKRSSTFYYPFIALLLMSCFQDNLNSKIFWIIVGFTGALKCYSQKTNSICQRF
jgi:O-antigen ligase